MFEEMHRCSVIMYISRLHATVLTNTTTIIIAHIVQFDKVKMQNSWLKLISLHWLWILSNDKLMKLSYIIVNTNVTVELGYWLFSFFNFSRRFMSNWVLELEVERIRNGLVQEQLRIFSGCDCKPQSNRRKYVLHYPLILYN